MSDFTSSETENKTYADIEGIQGWLLKQLKQLKIERPTPIQFHCIPPALAGRDVIGAAKTGSGKTLAFLIPILQALSVDPYGIYALVLTPTRELAFQISDQFRSVGVPMALRLSIIVGGLDKVAQGGELQRSPHIVVATPGRLADLMKTSPEITFKRIKVLVLDEADRLMDGRFDDQLKTIWEALPVKRQTLLFSATITDRLKRMKDLAASDVFVWQSQGPVSTVEQLEEKYVLVNPMVKDATVVSFLLHFQEKNPKALIMVFVETCKGTQILSMLLNELGITCAPLHSMISQKERLAALARFKSSQVKILVATDLASRGLDIPMVQLVINYDIPNLPKNYIHRVGRTARAGRSGQALTVVTPYELKLLIAIEGETKRKMAEEKADDMEVRQIMKQVNVTKREQQIKLDEMDFDERKNIIKRKILIMEGKDPDEEEYLKRKRINEKKKTDKQSLKKLAHVRKPRKVKR